MSSSLPSAPSPGLLSLLFWSFGEHLALVLDLSLPIGV